ncbi:MAG: BlaI/MecI/CopY family transcriptional regulator [Saprospiraceae bacterium]|jgi:predicted transcriptional regulator|nr:BlaI/MecI/CopY family transcriptional regulator [Saprospiraceae bacterium]
MKKYQPTDAELEILQVLWEKQPATVREIFDKVAQKKEVVYTTVLKQIQRLQEKGVLERLETNEGHQYRCLLDQVDFQRNWLQKTVDMVFDGSVSKMAMHAISEKADKSELEALKIWIENELKKQQ